MFPMLTIAMSGGVIFALVPPHHHHIMFNAELQPRKRASFSDHYLGLTLQPLVSLAARIIIGYRFSLALSVHCSGIGLSVLTTRDCNLCHIC